MTPVTLTEISRFSFAAVEAEKHGFRAIVAKTAGPAGEDALVSTASRIEKTPVSTPVGMKGSEYVRV
jgi:hypothetical protein